MILHKRILKCNDSQLNVFLEIYFPYQKSLKFCVESVILKIGAEEYLFV